jgi:signal transduction histidine kinase
VLGQHASYRRYRRDRNLVAAVVVCFSLMILSFVVSRTITEVQSRRIQREATSIGQNALVAAEALIAVRTTLRTLASSMNVLSTVAPAEALQLGRELESASEAMATSWAQYLSLPFYPGERALVDATEPELTAVQRTVDDLVERLHTGDLEGALAIASARAVSALDHADAGVVHILELNRHEAQAAAARITASTRTRGLLPEILGGLFALTSAALGVRVLLRYLEWSAERSAELEQFAGRVAHDLRSPLGSVSLTLDLVKKRKDVDAKTQELLARVARTLERVKQLIDDLLVFATAGGHLVPEESARRKANVREVLDGVIEDATLEAETREIELHYERPDPALFAACGPGALISIATNLVSNAMKFLGEAPLRRVTISARRLGRDVRLEVSDTGPGLAPELREKIFQPHVRGTSREAGFGLGLATVKKLVDAHGGEVVVAASAEGGCRFSVRLPAWTEETDARWWAAPRLSRGSV